jgi:hypothetical protein
MMRRSRTKAALCAPTLLTMTPAVRAAADPDAPPVLPPGAVQAGQQAAPPTEPSAVEPAKRDEPLGKGWHASGDRLWTTRGDGAGLHLLVAEAKTG